MPSSPVRPQNAFTGELEAPSLWEVLIAVLVSYFVFLAFLSFIGGSYWSLVGGNFGDNPAYLQAAAAIRHWQFSGVPVKQFWGLSYAVAGLSLVTRMSESTALAVVCVSASLVSVWLCYRLWDGWIAAFFALLNFDWFQRSLLGGAEPLFLALLLGSVLAIRRGRWPLAAVLGALATVVRPLGILLLFGLAVHLLRRTKIRDCALATSIALGVGALYAWPLAHYFGTPFANVALYQRNDWHGMPFNFPLVGIFHDTIPLKAPLTNLALTFGWILFVLVGLAVALRTGDLQDYIRNYTTEACFVVLYCLALYTYDAPGWSRSEFPRFAIPILPWTLFFLRRYFPMNRKVIWGLAVISPMLAAASAVGIRNVVHLFRLKP
jgi:hypothetical protein